MQHPNIVQIHEVGEHDGLPFFSLEFCAGGSLEKKLAGAPLPPREAATLVEKLARAMHAVHEQGVIHRDLKPANVLLAADGTPKITDFGLAKKLEDVGQTRTGAIMGTPSYMAPEQAGGGAKELGPPADIYALGAILYECLTGRPPFRAATALDTLMQVVADEPVPPSQLNPQTPRDLETIALKCLQKIPAKRYASAAALAGDLGRFGEGRPITARSVGYVERTVKWVRRRPTRAVFVVMAALLLATFGIGGPLVAIRQSALKDIADSKTTEALEREGEAKTAGERALQLSGELKVKADELETQSDQLKLQLSKATHMVSTNQLVRVGSIYQSDPEKAHELLHDYDSCPLLLRSSAWHYYANICEPHPNLPKGKKEAVFKTDRGICTRVVFSPDGGTLATVSESSNFGTDEIKLWDVATGKVKVTLSGFPFKGVTFSPDGSTLATGGGQSLNLWDVATGAKKGTLPGLFHFPSVQFSPDGKTLASAGKEKTVKLWDVAAGKEIWTSDTLIDHAPALSFRPDGKKLAVTTGGYAGVTLLDVENGKELVKLKADGRVHAVAFSPNGQVMAYNDDKIIKLWDVETGTVKDTLQPGADTIYSLAFSGDGGTLAVATRQGVWLWDMEAKQWKTSFKELIFLDRNNYLSSNFLAFRSDGKVIALAKGDQSVKLWEIASPRKIEFKGGTLVYVKFSPDSKTLASGGQSGNVMLWDIATRQGKALPGRMDQIMSVSFHPDGKTLAASDINKNIQLWDLAGSQRSTFMM